MFPPSFIEELRNRLSLAETIQRKVRLVKKGREYSGLCPFHNEKSPSFTVNEEKGFFHCFGCGAHGGLIDFVMRSQNLGFPEAVERLAAQAGMEVPRATPEARRQAEQQKTLREVLEAACRFFEAQLRSGSAAAARDYLQGRGLDAAACARFRIGFAPPANGLLRQHLERDFPRDLIVAAGLTRPPENGREPYDYFRDRIIFPILDRSGRVVAFGGRVMGDGMPKYLNSPETELFHKGRTLYGLAWALGAAGRKQDIVVTEGYMDVIALQLAGFEGAVAPLGTALTEDQLEMLWKLTPEPILCFDGDAAGQRAAERGMQRALPVLKPGRSLRFAILPAGQDPDSLIRIFGAGAMHEVLERARPLSEMLWQIELSRAPALTTPEQKADLLRRLNAQANLIPDESLRREYLSDVKNRYYAWKREAVRPASRVLTVRGQKDSRYGKAAGTGIAIPPPADPVAVSLRRRQEVLLRLAVDFPELLAESAEELAGVPLPVDLDKLRTAILNEHARDSGLDAEAMKHNLCGLGFVQTLERLFARQVSIHLGSSWTNDPEAVRFGWHQVLRLMRSEETIAEVEIAVRRFAEHPSEETSAYAAALPPHAELRTQEEAVQGADLERPEAGRR